MPDDATPRELMDTGSGVIGPEGGVRAGSASVGEGLDSTARRIADWLRGIRKTARTMLILQRVGWIVGGALLAVIVGGFADYFLRAPMELRTIGLVLALGVLGWFVLRLLLPAMRFRPSLTEIALRVEKSGAGSGVRGLLASGLELGRHPEELPARELVGPVVAEAAEKLTRVRAREVFSPRPTLRGLGAGVAAFMLVLGLTVTWPQHTQIGMARMLWPWGGAEWPKRTEVADGMAGVEHHPMGTALPLRAVLVRSDKSADPAKAAELTRVSAHYRLVTASGNGPERTVQLTDQGQAGEGTKTDGERAAGVLFERLIEPTGLTASAGKESVGGKGAVAKLEYWFETEDDRTPRRTIQLIEPPAIVHATAQITLPEYAARVLGAGAVGAVGAGGVGGTQQVDLGTGSDDRAAPAPILAGSQVRVSLEFNKALATPASMDLANEETRRWLQATFGPESMILFGVPAEGAPSAGAKLSSNGKVWTLTWQHWESVRLIVKPTDEYQITSGEDPVFRFDALKDNPPTASVTTPAEDKSVLATAVVDVAGEARDDVALAWVALERQVARKNATSEGGAPEPAQDRTELARVNAADQAGDGGADPGVKRLVSSKTLDLATIEGLKAGDEVWVTALAADAYELGGLKHEPVRSTVRKLRILSREQLVEQIWSELSTMRRTAIKLDQDQQDIAKARPPAGPAGEELSARGERAQAGVTERLSRQNQAVQRLQQRVKENGLTDQSMSDVLRQAKESLERAGQHSAEASKDLGEASREQSQEAARPDAGEQKLGEASKQQQQVRDELSNLIDMLDQGEDSFASKRSVERMLDQQRALRDRTSQEGRQTAGKPKDELSAQQQQELDKIAQEQKALAEQLRDAVKKMQERQAKVKEKDPAAAEAMAQAAAQAMRDQTPEKMDEASKEAGENQTSRAQQQQSAAIQSMEQMLQKMQTAQNNRDETLRRALASLMDSIEGLIKVQEVSIGALKEAGPKGAAGVAALEQPMVLHHQNTLGVLDMANAAGREASAVAGALDKAAEAMALTVPELRAGKAETALEHETAALDHLKEARDAAKKADQQAQQRQNDRKRTELRARYEQAAKLQAELRDSSQGLVGAEDNRRTKAAARALGQSQQELKAEVDKIRAETKEVSDAKVFDYAHNRLDTLMDAAAGVLGEGKASEAVVRGQTSAARLLKSLADALDDSKKQDDPFRENQQGGGGQGSGEPPLVPDAAEVALLRSMQQEALDLARSAADAPKADPGVVGDAAELQKEIAEQGKEFLKRMEKKMGGGGGRPRPAKPAGEKPGGPEGGGGGAGGDEPKKPEGEGGPQ